MTTTIGSLSNVPAPGDPVQAAWAQAVTGLAIHPYASLAALKAAWPTAPENAWAYLLDENSLCVGKGGTWRWYIKAFPFVAGNTSYLTWTASATAATSQSSLHLQGRAAILSANIALATAAQNGGASFCTFVSAFSPIARVDCAAGMGWASGAGSGRGALIPGGGISVFWHSGNNPNAATNSYVTAEYEVADLIVAA